MTRSPLKIARAMFADVIPSAHHKVFLVNNAGSFIESG